MAKAWAWIIVGVFILISVVWLCDFWFNYYTIGTCRDSYGRSYACQKAYRNADYDTNYYAPIDNFFNPSYSYPDNYGNQVVVHRDYNFDDYYDCYHANTADSRYGQILREQYGIVCNGHDAVNDNYNHNYNYDNNYNTQLPVNHYNSNLDYYNYNNQNTQPTEIPPTIYVN